MAIDPALERLADRVVAGRVTFFIGAGLSVDSEGNTAKRLIARLLARFAAVTQRLKRGRGAKKELANRLRSHLERTFWLKDVPWDDPSALLNDSRLKALAEHYYLVNDWFCSAFSDLARHMWRLDTKALNTIENQFLERYETSAKMVPIPLRPVNLKQLKALKDDRDAGKALFLDTMGFDNEMIMAGDPGHENLEEVEQQIAGRLLPRHRVLARLAMEGWSSPLITSNYDLLIDSAYRLAGMLPPGPSKPCCNVPLAIASERNAVSHYHRIAAADHYFDRGQGHRAALIVKMHGCVERYREARDRPDGGKHYLPAMVFTFREIQNWREDSWSRDLLQSLLRTRTMVFCGYSIQDPVIHDTVRTVYEEMAAKRLASAESPVAGIADAPVFFFDMEKQGNFHGVEILRAAAEAVGVRNPPLLDCPNLVEFVPRDREVPARFPTVDHLLRWLLHRCLRRRQGTALETHLAPVAKALLGRPCHKDELTAIQDRFADISSEEKTFSAQWTKEPTTSREFERHCGWTEHFHFSLLRQWMAAELIGRHQEPGSSFRLDWSRPGWSDWYCAMLDHPAWTAWGVVLELAIRNLHRSCKKAPPGADSAEWLRPLAAGDAATIDIAGSPSAPTPLRLQIRMGAPVQREVRLPPPLRGQVIWNLTPDTVPWTISPRQDLPSAKTLWALALGESPDELAKDDIAICILLRRMK